MRTLEVTVHGEPAEWWQIVAALTPLALLLGIATVFLWYAVRGLPSNVLVGGETRSNSWDRTRWALDMALDANPERQKVGRAVLDYLSTDHLMSKEDAKIVAQSRRLLDKQ